MTNAYKYQEPLILRKIFLKLDFLKIVSVLSYYWENKNEKVPSPLRPLHFLSPPSFGFPHISFKKLLLLSNYFGNFIPSFKRKGRSRVKTYVCSSKNMRNNIWLFLWVLVRIFWCFINDFTAASHVRYGFWKNSSD